MLGAAPIADYTALQLTVQPDDLVICADGGYHHLQPLGLSCDWLVGDFDSQSTGTAPHVLRAKPEKDDTDLKLAVEQGKALGYTRFVLVGVLGGRLDHSYATMQTLAWMTAKGLCTVVLDGQNRMTACHNNQITLHKDDYRYLSLFSYGEYCHGVTVTGCKYPLDDATLCHWHPLGVSNEMVAEVATIAVKDGMLFCIQSNE